MLSPYSQISVDRETGAFSFDLDLICSVLALAFVQPKVVIEKGNLFDQRQIQSQLSENGVTNESTIPPLNGSCLKRATFVKSSLALVDVTSLDQDVFR